MKLFALGTLIIGQTFALSALAATTGNITIQGSIPAATAIVVTATGPYNTLDLNTTQSNLQVANVREINNTTSGYTVKLTSANNGALKNGTLDSISYTATYDNVAATLSTTPTTVTSGTAQNTVVNVQKPFKISYAGVNSEDKMAGTYSDTLTFTITSP